MDAFSAYFRIHNVATVLSTMTTICEQLEQSSYNFIKPIDLGEVAIKDPLLAELAATTAFRRLNYVRFLGGIDYFLVPTPNGASTNTRYTRYQHSLGVAKLALLYADIRELNEKNRRLVYAAGLLHDIGHAPLSHSIEPVFEEAFGINHHLVTEDIISGQTKLGCEVNQKLRQYGVDPEHLIAVLSGDDDPFEGFFSGPINFDTIEGILRSRQYVKPGVISQNPLMVARAAINRKTNSDKKTVDMFWACKHEVYNLIIRSRNGVLVDHLCQHVTRQALCKLSKKDFFTTEKSLFNKIPELRQIFMKILPSYLRLKLEDEPVKYKTRQFFIDEKVNFFDRDDFSRYKQTKFDRILMKAAPHKIGTELAEWDLFDERSVQ